MQSFICRTTLYLSTFVILNACVCAGNPAGSAGAESAGIEFLIGDYRTDEGGSWNPESSPLKRPFGVDFDSSGTMFIVELEGGRVFKQSPSGELKQISGDGSSAYTGDGGPASSATFNGMHNCAVTPNGDLYISDSWNHCIRKIDGRTGVISTIAGTGRKGFSGDGGPATQAEFDYLMCITLNPDNDAIHVTDLTNRRIRTVNLRTGLVQTIAGNGKKGVPNDKAKAIESPLIDPRAAAADSKGNVYILERGGHALRVVRPDGTIHTVAGTGEKGFRDGQGAHAQLNSPKHLCVDSHDNVYIADDENAAIRLYEPTSGQVKTILGRGHGDARIQLSHPHGVCWENNSLIVVDTRHNRIMRIRP